VQSIIAFIAKRDVISANFMSSRPSNREPEVEILPSTMKPGTETAWVAVESERCYADVDTSSLVAAQGRRNATVQRGLKGVLTALEEDCLELVMMYSEHRLLLRNVKLR